MAPARAVIQQIDVDCCSAVPYLLQTTAGEVRARLGEVAHQRSDFVIVTNSSPCLEDPADIVQVGWGLFTAYSLGNPNIGQFNLTV